MVENDLKYLFISVLKRLFTSKEFYILLVIGILLKMFISIFPTPNHFFNFLKKRRLKSEYSQKANIPDNLVNTKVTDHVPICKKCGIPMVLKTAQKGQYVGNQFYGCKNFPNCREIVNITQQSSTK